MRVIMTGGGTGGHIYPAIAIADEIKKREPEAQILFVGAERGLEKKLVPDRGYEIKLIQSAGLDRKNPLKNFKVARTVLKGNAQSKKIIKDFKPDFVVGTGGYASGPIVRAAQKAKIPTYIHEQNAFPGMTNKLLEKGVRNVFLGFDAAKKYFKMPEKLVTTGNPVRDEFMTGDRAKAREALGYKPDEFVVLAFGGSQGAGRINKTMLNIIRKVNGRDDIKVCLGAGTFYYNAILATLADEGIQLAENIQIIEYIKDMATYLLAADLVVSRSGALTVAETTVSGVPAIFIPSPMVTGNHQYYNALTVSEKGGAILVEEKDLDDEKLLAKIIELKENPEKVKYMAEKSKMCEQTNATEIVCDVIFRDCVKGFIDE
ncbi:MAG: undecaprenyldiphospho-muramoylpentapeptide beta-N-acetylglucosaminyltransferase [Bacillota bacterium]|nr:undecaprenyldiphospho-muramoylpentapeptide beta-N-acetylglucosaminyltransferase [Bacillota bacterium]